MIGATRNAGVAAAAPAEPRASGATASARNAELLPAAAPHADDHDALSLLYKLTSQQGSADGAAKRGDVAQNRKAKETIRAKLSEARAKEAEAAKQREGGGGVFGGLKKIVSNVVDNVVNLRPADLVTDALDDVGNMVKDPNFWSDIGAAAKLAGKATAVAVAIAGTVLTGGAFAVACCVAVCVAMASSTAMEEGKLGERLGMSSGLQTAIGIGCSAVAIAGSAGMAFAASSGKIASDAALKAAQLKLETQKKAVAGVATALKVTGHTTEGVNTLHVAHLQRKLDFAHIETRGHDHELTRSLRATEQEISMMADIVRSYENALTSIHQAIETSTSAQDFILTSGARA